jgi:precorrin-6B methylase 2
MIESLQKATSSVWAMALKGILPADRRDHGTDIRLWNDRDPRVDQSFFQGSVPGFVIGHDQTIVDWNMGFELVFGALPNVKRGMPVSKWYELIENFRRLPKREEKLHGEAMLPITDRDRVVYLSQDFGRMVFSKIMSPVLDRVTGRVIGWNVALNINSVTERVKFFTEFNDRVQDASKHARYVMGIDQVAQKSRVFHDAVQTSIGELQAAKDLLIIGAVGAASFVEAILNANPNSRVSILDQDAEALRHLRHKLSRHGARVRIVRGSPDDVSIIPEERFDGVLLLWPHMAKQELSRVVKALKQKIRDHGVLSVVSWTQDNGADKFWSLVRRDLEKNHEIDLVRWHMGIIKEEAGKAPVYQMDSGSILASGLAQFVDVS